MTSTSGATRRPSTATSPLTRTRRRSMRSSHTRRLPSPAWASTFWSRMPSGSPSPGTGLALVEVVVEIDLVQVDLGGVSAAPCRVGSLDLVEPLAQGRAGRGPQPDLERLDHVGPGHELAERRQLLEGVDAQALEEEGRGAEEHGLAGARVLAHLGDEAPLVERPHDAVD